MRRFLALAALAAALAFGCAPARAQNATCPDVVTGDSSQRCANTKFVQTAIAGGSVPLAQNFIFVGSAAGFAIGVPLSGDCTIVSAGVITCTKTNGTPFALVATSGSATDLGTGTLPAARLPAFGSGDVSFASAGGAGTIAAGAVTFAKVQNVAADNLIGNPTAAPAAPTNVPLTSCSTASSALTYNTSTHAFGCNAISGTAQTLPPPQGRLTLQSGAPVMSASQANKATIFYDCYLGGSAVPYFNGSVDTFDTISSCEVPDAMVSAASAGQILANQVYDVIWVHGGANHICVPMSASTGGGGGWASDSTSDAAHTGNTHTSTLIDNLSTNVVKFGWLVGMTITGSGIPGATTIVSIGSDGLSVVISAATTTTLTGTTLTVTGGTNTLRGFSYTQIDKVTRSYATNRNVITNCFNGATNYGPVAANQGTYLGTFFATANGQTSFTYGSNATGGGQAASLYVWNAYNKMDIKTSVSDSVSNWTIADALVHSFHDDAGTRINFVLGLAEDSVGVALFDQTCGVTNPNYPIMAIGFALDRSGNTTFDKLNINYVNSAAILAGNPRACGPISTNGTYNGLLGSHFIQALANQDGQATPWTGEYYGGIRTSFDGYFRM